MSDGIDQASAPFHVEQHESLPEVLERLRGHRGESLTLVIPDHSPVLLTATEFRALKDLIDRNHIRLQLQTQDSLRLQLASMFGLAKPVVRREPHLEEEDTIPRAGSWRNARRPRHRNPGEAPTEPDRPVETDDEPIHELNLDPITVSRRRRNRLYGDSAPRKEELIDDAGLDYIADDDDTSSGTSRAWLLGRIAAAVLLVVLIAGVALWYYMPAVTVDVTLQQAPVSTEIIYSVASPGATLPSDSRFRVDAVQQSAVVPFTISIPASGVIREPGNTAAGPMQFRNVSDQSITLEQGTEMTTVTGTKYLLLEPVEIPAGSVDDPGEASGEVTAADPGSGGNVAAGGLTGKLPDLDVYYSNLDGPIEGGDDRIIPQVTQEDVDEAQRSVVEELRPAAVDGWESTLPEGKAVVEPSVEPGEPDFDISGAAGDQLDAVTVTGTVSVTGLVYDLSEVEKQSRSTFELALQDQVPPGYALDASTIALGEPELVAEAPENVEYRVSATATAVAVFDEGAQEGLRERMAGEDVDNARAAIQSVGAIASWEMSQSPGWWPDRMPQGANRITITINDVDGNTSGAPTPAELPGVIASPEDGTP